MTFELTATWLNGILLLGFTLVPIVTLIATRNPDSGATRAHRYSVRARLPFGSDEVAQSVRRHVRTVTRTNMWALLAVMVLSLVAFAIVPWRGSPFFLWGVLVLLLLVVLGGAPLISGLRERLFSPAPTAIRIARGRQMRTRDYLGPWRRLTPTVLLALAIVAVVAAFAWQPVARHRAEPWMLWLCAGALMLAIAVSIGTHLAERAVLAQPQPASNTLELAWDDSFRADVLGSLRLAAASAAWISLGVATTTLWVSFAPNAEFLYSFPWWALPLLQVLYTLGEGRMRESLYPEFLAPRPTLTVGEALT